MRTPEMRRQKSPIKTCYSLQINTVLISAALTLSMASLAQGEWASTKFSIVSSQFHRRDADDAGEARICIQNTGREPLSMAQLRVQILTERTTNLEGPPLEQRCLYNKLSPPVLRQGEYGEIVAKLLDQPTEDCRLTCGVSAKGGAIPDAVPMPKSPLWIPHIGFSKDFQRVFVYVENIGSEPMKVELLTVGGFDLAGQTRSIHFPVPPEDKGCLTGDLPSPLRAGEFVHVVIARDAGGQESKVHAVVRAIHAFPIVMEHDSGDSRLGLDMHRPFLETMACPAHKHGSEKAAAAKFLDDYAQRFSETPGRVIQMAICRSNMPRAWFRFGNLPDVAAMNPCLRPPSRYERYPQQWFCPFSCVGCLANRATEPGRYLAIIPTGPGATEGSLLLKGLAPQEWRFLVCCAVASGAKGVIYRGQPADDPLSRDAFGHLNRELQHLKPLLSIAEPVEWTTTRHSDHDAKGLLCGDQALLIVVFDCRYFSRQRDGRFYTPPFARAVTPVRIDVRIPEAMVVHDVRTPFASLDPSSWDFRDGVLGLTAEMVNSAQIYIASLQQQNESSEGDQLP